MKDYLHDEAEKTDGIAKDDREEFIKKHGESLAGFWEHKWPKRQEATSLKSVTKNIH
jgi:hypothetical protein